jgi:hypothetical protein
MKSIGPTWNARLSRFAAAFVVALLAACADRSLPTQPFAVSVAPATAVSLEGEAGSGDGQVRERSRASGGHTVHLGPREHRLWTFAVRAAPMPYAVSVTYSNGKEGENEVISVTVAGALVSSFRNRDSGDSIEGWNIFVTDPAGTSTLGSRSHTLMIDVHGGDGCVEIDMVTLSPAESACARVLGQAERRRSGSQC